MASYLHPPVTSGEAPPLGLFPVPPSSQHRLPALPLETGVVEASAVLDLGEFIRRHYKTILVATLLGLGAAYAFTKSQPSVFRAAATIEIQDLNDNFLNLKEVSPVSASPQSPYTNDMQTQLRILESSSLIERVLNQLPEE